MITFHFYQHPKMKDKETRQKFPMDVKADRRAVRDFKEAEWDEAAIKSGSQPDKKIIKEKSKGRDRGINDLKSLKENNPFQDREEPEKILNENLGWWRVRSQSPFTIPVHNCERRSQFFTIL
jgi:hypothetical protein